jgi:hypothetical protein
MTPLVGHVVRMTGGQCAPDDMGGGWVCRVWGQAESRTWPSRDSQRCGFGFCSIVASLVFFVAEPAAAADSLRSAPLAAEPQAVIEYRII